MVPSLRFSLQQCKVKMVLVFLCSQGHAFVLFSCSPSPSVTWAGDWWDHLNLLQPITHQLPFKGKPWLPSSAGSFCIAWSVPSPEPHLVFLCFLSFWSLRELLSCSGSNLLWFILTPGVSSPFCLPLINSCLLTCTHHFSVPCILGLASGFMIHHIVS